jgi:hypothetical protein
MNPDLFPAANPLLADRCSHIDNRDPWPGQAPERGSATVAEQYMRG